MKDLLDEKLFRRKALQILLWMLFMLYAYFLSSHLTLIRTTKDENDFVVFEANFA